MMTATKVKELEFSDLYLGHPGLADRFSDVPGSGVNPLPAGPALRDDLTQLTNLCAEERKRSPNVGDFKVSYDEVNYRVSVMPSQGGNVFVLRKIADTISSMAELGIPQAYIRRAMTRDLSGLFVVSGAIKSGKTMTACAMLKDRLTAYGGVAVTGEDPIELPLEGGHGQGVCFQTTAPRNPSQFIDAFRNLVRWGARIILIDEIRDQDVAAEVLQASINGHLIITTMLAENVVQTITKLHALANDKLAPGSARSLLADGLVGVLHQQLVRGPKHSAKLETEFLFLKDAPVTKTVLRKGEYELLATDIRQQMAAMITENAAAQRLAVG
ncbi:MAG TPA: ATPase, T2SS/T4P/T4SS family [Noviherbaspirillum sp.]|nr:ATPase, T2SS/T4P/T4SS family [Noviherbaspirillum sp.]